ncbi:MAG: DUF4429 domain-containing protein [Cyanobacteria bacterium P01_F01_bin.150]
MTTSKSNTLQLAKQGNSKAITALINRQLQPKGISVKTSKKDGILQVLLEAEQAPDQQTYCAILEKGLRKITPENIRVVKVYGKSHSEVLPDWDYSFSLTQLDNPSDTERNQASNLQSSNQTTYFEAVGRNGRIRLSKKRVIISREGFVGFLSQGMSGKKEIPIGNITAVQFRPAGPAFTGYLQFSVIGGLERQGGVFKAVSDENTVIFTQKNQPNFEEVKRYVDSIIDDEPIILEDLRYTDPGSVEVEKAFWDKPIELNKGGPRKAFSDQNNQVSINTTNRVSAGVCGILLGYLGVHKFILGYKTEGFILLGITILSGGFLAGITFLVGLIEGILYLTKPEQEFYKTYVLSKRGWF